MNEDAMADFRPVAPVLLAAFPRSGQNWVRYCFELCSGWRSAGRPLLVKTGPSRLDRTHDATGRYWWGPVPSSRLFNAEGRPNYSRLLVLLRNYKEGLACEGCNNFERMHAYIGNLQAYRAFAGPRLLVYYEDLIQDFSWMRRILQFLDVPQPAPDFDEDWHRARSTLMYHARRVAWTRQQPLDFTLHSRRLAAERRQQADQWFISQIGLDVYQQFLGRYHESVLVYPE